MATMQQKAMDRAAALGVELDPEDGNTLEVWSYHAHLTDDPMGGSHTYIINREGAEKPLTDAGMWREALRWMDELIPCPEDCDCRDPKPGEPEPDAATPEDGDETPEVAAYGTFGVEWPESVARLFFRALAKDGTGYLVEAHGLTRFTNNAKMVLQITGEPDDAQALAARLPGLFHDANESLKQWRKTNDNYRRFLPLTKATASPAFRSEQDYLREFCRAVAGLKTGKTNPDGYAAGLAYREEVAA